jgi:hypothetical protein
VLVCVSSCRLGGCEEHGSVGVKNYVVNSLRNVSSGSVLGTTDECCKVSLSYHEIRSWTEKLTCELAFAKKYVSIAFCASDEHDVSGAFDPVSTCRSKSMKRV